MEYKELASGLNTFSYNLNKLNITELDVTQEIVNRSIINRLYYSLYNRILEELPDLQTSTTSNKHEQIESRLQRCTQSNTCRYTYNTFRELKTLRVWADYHPTQNTPPTNLTTLLSKTNKIIKYNKIFP